MIERLPIRAFADDLTSEGMERIAAWPPLARLTCLEVTTGLGCEEWEDCRPGLLALASSPLTGKLRRLRIEPQQYDAEALAAIGDSPYLDKIVDLDLRGDYGAPDSALRALADSGLPDRLERLNLAWIDIDPPLVRHFLERGRLRELHFGLSEAAEGVGPLLQVKRLSRLRLLEVTGEEHGFYVDELPYPSDHRTIEYLPVLLNSPLLSGVEELSLRGIALGNDGARALADSPMARNLVHLRLDLCGLTGDGLRALRPLLAEGRLRRLSLEHNIFETEDALELAAWPELRRLHRLSLGYFNHIGDEGRAAVKNSPHRHPYLSVG
jgi:hypothetical protein